MPNCYASLIDIGDEEQGTDSVNDYYRVFQTPRLNRALLIEWRLRCNRTDVIWYSWLIASLRIRSGSVIKWSMVLMITASSQIIWSNVSWERMNDGGLVLFFFFRFNRVFLSILAQQTWTDSVPCLARLDFVFLEWSSISCSYSSFWNSCMWSCPWSLSSNGCTWKMKKPGNLIQAKSISATVPSITSCRASMDRAVNCRSGTR